MDRAPTARDLSACSTDILGNGIALFDGFQEKLKNYSLCFCLSCHLDVSAVATS
jgi:hypothetical protein